MSERDGLIILAAIDAISVFNVVAGLCVGIPWVSAFGVAVLAVTPFLRNKVRKQWGDR